jgi:NAD(P)-dependent dehydrogenase (short-subunit alcohol dehydrogenase family)
MNVALITGGSKGIGFSVAETLLQEGWNVAITGRNQSSLDEAEKLLISKNNSNILVLRGDVRNLEDQQQAVGKILNKWGRIDALIANAGIGYFESIESLSEESWSEMINTNLTGVFYSIKACLEALKKSEGYIITIGSLAGTNFFAGGSGYNATKFGLVGLTQAAMLDLRPLNIKVSTIMPGSVATNFNGRTPSDADSWKIQPEDMGELVLDLLKMNPRTLPSKIEVRPSRPKGT